MFPKFSGECNCSSSMVTKPWPNEMRFGGGIFKPAWFSDMFGFSFPVDLGWIPSTLTILLGVHWKHWSDPTCWNNPSGIHIHIYTVYLLCLFYFHIYIYTYTSKYTSSYMRLVYTPTISDIVPNHCSLTQTAVFSFLPKVYYIPLLLTNLT